MLQALLEPSAFAVFLAIAAAGFLLLLVSLIFGELFEHFDVAVDHDLDHGGPGLLQHPRPECLHHRLRRVRRNRHALRPVDPRGFGLSGSSAASSSARSSTSSPGFCTPASLQRRAHERPAKASRRGSLSRFPRRVSGRSAAGSARSSMDKVARSADGRPIAEGASVKIDEVLGETVIVSAVKKAP